jgi:hypothetical protein
MNFKTYWWQFSLLLSTPRNSLWDALSNGYNFLKAIRTETPTAASTAAGVTIDDILKLVQVKLADDLIISQIRKSGKPFLLSTDDMVRLKTAGTGDRVIRVMVDPKAPDTVPQQAVTPVAAGAVLSRSQAGALIAEVRGLPHVETVAIQPRYLKRSGSDGTGFPPPVCIVLGESYQDVRQMLTEFEAKRLLTVESRTTRDGRCNYEWAEVLLTPEGKQYLFGANEQGFVVGVSDIALDEVTGIQMFQENRLAVAMFTLKRINVTPFQRNNVAVPGGGQANFSLFDDGWRIEGQQRQRSAAIASASGVPRTAGDLLKNAVNSGIPGKVAIIATLTAEGRSSDESSGTPNVAPTPRAPKVNSTPASGGWRLSPGSNNGKGSPQSIFLLTSGRLTSEVLISGPPTVAITCSGTDKAAKWDRTLLVAQIPLSPGTIISTVPGAPTQQMTTLVADGKEHTHRSNVFHQPGGGFFTVDKGATKEILTGKSVVIKFQSEDGPAVLAPFAPEGIDRQLLETACGASLK